MLSIKYFIYILINRCFLNFKCSSLWFRDFFLLGDRFYMKRYMRKMKEFYINIWKTVTKRYSGMSMAICNSFL